MSNILQHYTRLRENLTERVNGKHEHLLPVLAQAGLLLTPPVRTEDHTELWRQLAAFRPNEGWLCFQSAVVAFTDGNLPIPDAGCGWILTGEMVNSQGQSLHIQRHPESGWVITTYTEQDGGGYLVQPFAFLSTDENTLGKLHYRIYWQYNPDQGYQRRFSRFTGFAKEGI